MPKFSYEQHKKQMRDILGGRRPSKGGKPNIIQSLLDKVKGRGKPPEGVK